MGKRIFWTVFILATAFPNTLLALAGYEKAPAIAPNQKDVTVLPGQSYTFTCNASEPITWKYDDSIIDAHILATNKSSADFDAAIDYTYSSDEGSFQSSIELRNITYIFVGYYYCVKNSSENDRLSPELSLSKKASRVYLFVEDLENPMVLFPHAMLSDDPQHKIPCKPTSPKSKVQLERTWNHEKGLEAFVQNEYDGFEPLSMKNEDATFDCISNKITRFITRYKSDHLMYLLIPKIISKTHDFGISGGQLELVCTIENSGLFHGLNIAWHTPNGDRAFRENRIKIEKSLRRDFESGHYEWYVYTSKLTVMDFDGTKDIGTYQCLSQAGSAYINSTEFNVTREYKNREVFLNVQNVSPKEDFVQSLGDEIEWKVSYNGNPEPTVFWRDNRGREIPWSEAEDKNAKFVDAKSNNIATLKIRNLNFDDKGNYVLFASNKHQEKQQAFRLSVEDLPQVKMADTRFERDEKINVTCEIYGHPFSNISIGFQSCFNEVECFGKPLKLDISPEQGEIKVTRTASFVPESGGKVTCTAKNTVGSREAISYVIPNKNEDDFKISSDRRYFWDDDSYVDEIKCAANGFKYADSSDDITFEVMKNDGTIIPAPASIAGGYPTYEVFSWYQKLNEYKPAGKYVCKARRRKTGSVEERVWWVNKTQLVKKVAYSGEPFELDCIVGDATPNEIHWYMNDTNVPASPKIRLTNTTLSIRRVEVENGGKYECIVMDSSGEIHTEIILDVKPREIREVPPSPPEHIKLIIISSIAAISVLLFILIFSFWRIYRQRQLLRELKAAGLANFEEGNPGKINPNLPLDEQADLLPYDTRFEFPRDKLKLDKQLGSGAFGIVMKATAKGIRTNEEETTVAVKMVKHMADYEEIRALISELKIMAYLGQHLNVVNLLGAVTKNIVRRELMVIVEYCQYGNLQNVLVNNRNSFVDQIVYGEDTIDPSILSNNSDDVTADYTTVSCLSLDEIGSSGETENVSSASVHSVDNEELKMKITTTDLLCWSFQIARGMDYLASRKVLHGDLAARNILLCDDNVVKICDFGLARSIYKGENYRKKSEGKLPFKWLAIESLGDLVFSTYSDVWSFGIVLWELFSLGKPPYLGIDDVSNLHAKLKDGYRLEKPDFATENIYAIMQTCWLKEPKSRPLFDSLEKSFAKIIGNETIKPFFGADSSYSQSNLSNGNSSSQDYPSATLANENIFAASSTSTSTQNSKNSSNNMEMSPIH